MINKKVAELGIPENFVLEEVADEVHRRGRMQVCGEENRGDNKGEG